MRCFAIATALLMPISVAAETLKFEGEYEFECRSIKVMRGQVRQVLRQFLTSAMEHEDGSRVEVYVNPEDGSWTMVGVQDPMDLACLIGHGVNYTTHFGDL